MGGMQRDFRLQWGRRMNAAERSNIIQLLLAAGFSFNGAAA